jgi:hypothetical protein
MVLLLESAAYRRAGRLLLPSAIKLNDGRSFGEGEARGMGSSSLNPDANALDDHFRSDIADFTSLPGFDLLSHRLEVAMHPIDGQRDAIDSLVEVP